MSLRKRFKAKRGHWCTGTSNVANGFSLDFVNESTRLKIVEEIPFGSNLENAPFSLCPSLCQLTQTRINGERHMEDPKTQNENSCIQTMALTHKSIFHYSLIHSVGC